MSGVKGEFPRRYWLRWTIACGVGEFLGIAVAAGIWWLHTAVFGEPQAVGQQVLLLVFMILAGVIEGSVTGAFQWSVLRARFGGMRARNWLLFTALGAAVGWLLGMLPSTFFNAAGDAGGFDLSGFMFIVMAALMGLVLGALFGLFQWFELRKHALSAGRWVPANMLGWLAGMVVIFLGASMPSEGTALPVIIVIGAVSGLLGGLLVGAVTGLFLVKIAPLPEN